MTHFEKRQRVIAELELGADRSNREIARKLNLSEGLVRVVRKALEQSGSIQVRKRDRGGRPPKQSQSPARKGAPLEDAELSEIVPSELVVSPAGEARQRLQQRVLDLVLDLVSRMSVGELAGAIGDLEKAGLSHQDAAPATTQAKSTTDEALQVILASVATGEITPDQASLLLGKPEVHPGATMPGILEAVAKGELPPEEAAAFIKLVEIHPSEGELPADARSHQDATTTEQPEGKLR
jgi:hypothetical protein